MEHLLVATFKSIRDELLVNITETGAVIVETYIPGVSEDTLCLPYRNYVKSNGYIENDGQAKGFVISPWSGKSPNPDYVGDLEVLYEDVNFRFRSLFTTSHCSVRPSSNNTLLLRSLYEALVVPDENYKLTSVKVNGMDVAHTDTAASISLNNILGDVIIVAEAELNKHAIDYREVQSECVTSSNTATEITHGKTYVTTLSKKEGYATLGAGRVTVGGVLMDSWNEQSGDKEISVVADGDIYIEAACGALETYTASFSSQVNCVILDGQTTEIPYGSRYQATLKPAVGYSTVGAGQIVMNGSVVDSWNTEAQHNIDINSVTGNIVITVACGSVLTYSITLDSSARSCIQMEADGVVVSGGVITEIPYGTSKTVDLNPISPYINIGSGYITMDGVRQLQYDWNNSPSSYSLTITNIIGDIVIYADCGELNKYSITYKYQDIHGNQIHQDDVVTGIESGTNVDVTQKRIPIEHYTFTRQSPDGSVVITQDTDVVLTYTEDPKYNVTVKYVDLNNNEIATSETITGKYAGDEITSVTIKTIEDYNYDSSTSTPLPFTVTSNPSQNIIYVKYIYDPGSVTLTVNYVDDLGGSIPGTPSESRSYTEGTLLTPQQLETSFKKVIQGYEYTSGIPSTTLVMDENKTITLIYTKLVTLTVEYLDENGTTIHSSQTDTYSRGDVLNSSELEDYKETIQGYDYYSGLPNTLTMNEDKTITLVYTPTSSSLIVTPSTLTIPQGSSDTAQITNDCYIGNRITFDNVPSGITLSENNGTLTISVGASVQPGTYTFNVLNECTNSATVTVIVPEPGVLCSCNTLHDVTFNDIPSEGVEVSDNFEIGTYSTDSDDCQYTFSEANNAFTMSGNNGSIIVTSNISPNTGYEPNEYTVIASYENSECVREDIIQEGSLTCDCNSIGLMVTLKKSTYSNDGTSDWILVAEGNTYGCGSLDGFSNSEMLDIDQTTGSRVKVIQDPNDESKFEFYIKVLPNSGIGDRSGGINLYFKKKGEEQYQDCNHPLTIYLTKNYCDCDNFPELTKSSSYNRLTEIPAEGISSAEALVYMESDKLPYQCHTITQNGTGLPSWVHFIEMRRNVWSEDYRDSAYFTIDPNPNAEPRTGTIYFNRYIDSDASGHGGISCYTPESVTITQKGNRCDCNDSGFDCFGYAYYSRTKHVQPLQTEYVLDYTGLKCGELTYDFGQGGQPSWITGVTIDNTNKTVTVGFETNDDPNGQDRSAQINFTVSIDGNSCTSDCSITFEQPVLDCDDCNKVIQPYSSGSATATEEKQVAYISYDNITCGTLILTTNSPYVTNIIYKDYPATNKYAALVDLEETDEARDIEFTASLVDENDNVICTRTITTHQEPKEEPGCKCASAILNITDKVQQITGGTQGEIAIAKAELSKRYSWYILDCLEVIPSTTHLRTESNPNGEYTSIRLDDSTGYIYVTLADPIVGTTAHTTLIDINVYDNSSGTPSQCGALSTNFTIDVIPNVPE